MNQIINMIVRQVMHQLVRRGVNAGFDQASKMGKRREEPEYDADGNPVVQRQITPTGAAKCASGKTIGQSDWSDFQILIRPVARQLDLKCLLSFKPCP